jgi:hypothetical protein
MATVLSGIKSVQSSMKTVLGLSSSYRVSNPLEREPPPLGVARRRSVGWRAPVGRLFPVINVLFPAEGARARGRGGRILQDLPGAGAPLPNPAPVWVCPTCPVGLSLPILPILHGRVVPQPLSELYTDVLHDNNPPYIRGVDGIYGHGTCEWAPGSK